MTAGILLAAGQSLRFGKSKQLASFNGTPLLRRAAEMLIDSGLSPRIVVLADIDEVSPERDELLGDINTLARHSAALARLDVEIAVNAKPEQGMSSSIRIGLAAALRAAPDIAGALITVCDQPLCTAAHLRTLMGAAHEPGVGIVASGYSGTAGVPAWFAARMFPGLAALDGDRGAAQLIRSFRERCPEGCRVIPFPQGELDIDTPADLDRLT